MAYEGPKDAEADADLRSRALRRRERGQQQREDAPRHRFAPVLVPVGWPAEPLAVEI
jgi:hypothetical protein